MKKCPVCNENELHPDDVMNSLSSKDNQTYICNACGTKESIDEIEQTLAGELAAEQDDTK